MSCPLETEIKHLKLNVLGNDDSGEPTNLRQQITKFSRLGKTENVSPVEIELDDKSTYLRLMLYYKEDLIEEETVKRVRVELPIAEETTDKIAQQIGVEVSEDIIGRKKSIQTNYEQAKNETNRYKKGILFEQVICQIIELVPGLQVIRSRLRQGPQEIDILVRNHNRKNVWADFEGIIFIECKNWAKRVPAKEIRNFEVKLTNKGLVVGIFIAINGFTGKDKDGAQMQIQTSLTKKIKIIVVDDKDIQAILNCKDVSSKIDEKYIALYM